MHAQVTHFEISNESWKTNQAAQYAWALLDWAPALKKTYSAALVGANGPAGRSTVGDKDQGIGWWSQVIYLSALLLAAAAPARFSRNTSPLRRCWVPPAR